MTDGVPPPGTWSRIAGAALALLRGFVVASFRASSGVLRFVLNGPPLIIAPDRRGWVDTLLTWPVRLVAVVGLVAVARVWAGTPAGIQLGWALQYSMLAAISIVSSFWFPLFIANLAAALWWVWLTRKPPEPAVPPAPRTRAQANASAPESSPPTPWGLPDLITWLNRQIGHLEAGATWSAVALVVSHALDRQITGLALVVFLGAPLVNALSLALHEKARESQAALMMQRRSIIYASTVLGLLVMGAQAPKQAATLLPLALTVLPGLVFRYVRYLMRRRQEADREVWDKRLARAEMQQHVARATGWIGPVLVTGFFLAAVGLSVYQRARIDAAARADLEGPALPTDTCAPEAGGPVTPSLAMFILADTQIHELGKQRFPGQMEVANALVPVCRRPVELDMLSTAAVVRYAAVYRELSAARRAKNLPAPLWSHLGDLADLGCTCEVTRMVNLLGHYGPARLAGVAPGNHDSTFQGNFAWSPYWDEACSGRASKEGSDAALATLQAASAVPVTTVPVRGWAPAGLSPRAHLGQAALSRLGEVPGADGGRARGVIGVFIDTSDRGARDYGIAGSFGTFSKGQREAILKALAPGRGLRDSTGAYARPWYVVFGHVPYDELTDGGRSELANLIAALDGLDRPGRDDGAGGDDGEKTGPRVLALVTAHTHTAATHRHCIGQRIVRELVIGSVIDPPQQAALLEIGNDERGRLALRLRTLPSVARPGFTCDQGANGSPPGGIAGQSLGDQGGIPGAIPAAACREAMARLQAEPACDELLALDERGREPGSSLCAALERPLSLAEQLSGIVRHGGPDEPDELKKADDKRAETLLRCLCRGKSAGARPPTAPAASGEATFTCTLPAQPADAAALCAAAERGLLEREAYAPAIEALAHDPARQEELTCLSWAAGALQAHKAAGMTFATAVRCAFDDPTLPPALSTVALAEEAPCYR